MKKLFFGIITTLFFIGNTFGQGKMRAAALEKIEAYRVEYFTENLELTPKEAEAFYPIFNAYQEKREAIRKSGNKKQKVELMSDAEVESYLGEYLEKEQKLLDVKKEFFRQVKSVLPSRKVALIPQTEKNFRKEILSEMRRRRQENRGKGRFKDE